MKQATLLNLALLVAACSAIVYAQSPTPTPPPMTVPLSGSATIPVAQVVQQSVTAIKIEWILIEPEKARITLKIQPFNKEFYVDGENYAAVRAALRPGLEANLLPMVMPQINQYAAELNNQANSQ